MELAMDSRRVKRLDKIRALYAERDALQKSYDNLCDEYDIAYNSMLDSSYEASVIAGQVTEYLDFEGNKTFDYNSSLQLLNKVNKLNGIYTASSACVKSLNKRVDSIKTNIQKIDNKLHKFTTEDLLCVRKKLLDK